jgi:hypothetical protein
MTGSERDYVYSLRTPSPREGDLLLLLLEIPQQREVEALLSG